MEWHFILIEQMTTAVQCQLTIKSYVLKNFVCGSGGTGRHFCISDTASTLVITRVGEANAIQINMEASSFPDAEYPASTDGYTTGSYPALGYATPLICRTKQCALLARSPSSPLPLSVSAIVCDMCITARDSDHSLLDPAALAEDRPRILLLGLRRSGKTSIQKVVFEKMSPHSTLLMEATGEPRVKDISNTPFFKFQIWDFPGKYDFADPALASVLDPDLLFKRSHAIVFVIDGQDDPHTEALDYIVRVSAMAHKVRCAPVGWLLAVVHMR